MEERKEGSKNAEITETAKQRAGRLAKVREGKKRRIATKIEEQKEHQSASARKAKDLRAKDTLEHKATKLARKRPRKRTCTADETPEQRDPRLASARNYQRLLARETPEKRAERLRKGVEYRKLRKKAMQALMELEAAKLVRNKKSTPTTELA